MEVMPITVLSLAQTKVQCEGEICWVSIRDYEYNSEKWHSLLHAALFISVCRGCFDRQQGEVTHCRQQHEVMNWCLKSTARPFNGLRFHLGSTSGCNTFWTGIESFQRRIGMYSLMPQYVSFPIMHLFFGERQWRSVSLC